MKRLTDEELIAAHRIFNRVVEIVSKTHQNYHGRKTLGEIKDFVSSNRWIMFPVANINSLREGAESPTPNIYVSFNDAIQDDGGGRVEGGIGLSFNNSGAMLWLGELFKKSNAPLFMSILNGLNSEWSVEISQKIKTNYHEAAPIYETVDNFLAPVVTVDEIRNSIKKSDKILPRPGDDHQTGPVLGAITIVSVWKETSIGVFDNDTAMAFDLFFRVLTLR